MKVLVTGATGFIGSHLLAMLVERDDEVRILARPGEDVTRLTQTGVEVYWEDLSDCMSLEAAVDGVGRVPSPRWHIPYRLAFSIGATAEMTGRLLHWKQPLSLTRSGVEVLSGENRFTINRARSELGFIPQVSLAEGVHEGIAWFRATRHVAGS